ncbi:helix-turn-helix domain-containing protein [Lysobacter terrae]
MTSIASVLKAEITRLARKEVRALVEPLRKANTKQRHEIAGLRRQVAEQQRAITTLKRSSGKAPTASNDAETTTTARFSAKGLKSLRARLELSAADLGRLIGTSGQSVYHWESGKTIPRASQKAAIAGIRSLGKRAARDRLDGLSAMGK